MYQRQPDFYTPEEYLALEEKADGKSEYYQGEIFAMAGGSCNHNVIAGNFYSALNQSLQAKPCVVFTSDMRLFVEEVDLYTYPDVMVVCGQPQFIKGRTDTVTNPLVIVEVLSNSTQEYDRGLKFELYRTLDSLKDFLLIDQHRIYVEYFHKSKDSRWMLVDIKSVEKAVTIESVGIEIPIARIYHKVDWFAG